MLEELLEKIKNEYSEILKDNLVGIYLHGSIVFGYFNPEKSDVDFIVVIKNRLNYETQNNLIDTLVQMDGVPEKGFEMSVVLRQYCVNFEYPTPYELHFSNDWLNKYLNDFCGVCNEAFKTDKDLAAHFTIIKHCGQVLCGQPISDVFGDVKRDYYVDSIYEDVAHAKEEILKNPVYVILNLCRVLAYLQEDKILSKEQGGLWGVERLKAKYASIIQRALSNYRDNIEINISDNVQIEFAEYMLNKIEKYI